MVILFVITFDRCPTTGVELRMGGVFRDDVFKVLVSRVKPPTPPKFVEIDENDVMDLESASRLADEG